MDGWVDGYVRYEVEQIYVDITKEQPELVVLLDTSTENMLCAFRGDLEVDSHMVIN